MVRKEKERRTFAFGVDRRDIFLQEEKENKANFGCGEDLLSLHFYLKITQKRDEREVRESRVS